MSAGLKVYLMWFMTRPERDSIFIHKHPTSTVCNRDTNQLLINEAQNDRHFLFQLLWRVFGV